MRVKLHTEWNIDGLQEMHRQDPSRVRAPADSEVERDIFAEFRRAAGARWIGRARYLPSESFDWMSRRVAKGLRAGVAARIEDGSGRILLVRMQPSHSWTRDWVTPGGGLEPGESPRVGVLREISEESGVKVRNLRLWKVFSEAVRGPHAEVVRWYFLQYTALCASGRPETNVPEEIAEVRWFSRLPKNMAFRDDWLYVPRAFFDRSR